MMDADLSDDPIAFRDAVFKLYPKLEAGGGFELLKAEKHCSTLSLINPPMSGFTTFKLQSVVPYGKFYVRPLQTDLSLEMEEGKTVMTETCQKCNAVVQLVNFKQHMDEAHGVFDDSGSELPAPFSPFSPVVTTDENSDVDLPDPFHSPTTTRSFQQVLMSSFQQPRDELATVTIDLTVESETSNYTTTSTMPNVSLPGTSSANIQSSPLPEQYSPAANVVCSGSPLEIMIKKLAAEHVNRDLRSCLIVQRSKVWKSLINDVESGDFNFNAEIKVEFSAEFGQDEGGLKRDYFRLILKELMANTQLSVGSPGNICFTHNLTAMDKGYYCIFGKVVMQSILQGGPGFPTLNSCMFNLMFSAARGKDSDIVPCVETQNKIKKLLECKEDNEFMLVKEELADYIVANGYPNIYTANLSKLPEIVVTLIENLVYYNSLAEINEFKRGLESVCPGILNRIEENPMLFRPLFVADLDKNSLTRSTFKELYSVERSPAGSNSFVKEEETMYCWEKFLQNIERNKIYLKYNEDEDPVLMKFEDVLTFITAADRVPAIGFHQAITITFYDWTAQSRDLPSSSTCALELRLPRTEEDFTDKLIMAIAEGNLCFGNC